MKKSQRVLNFINQSLSLIEKMKLDKDEVEEIFGCSFVKDLYNLDNPEKEK